MRVLAFWVLALALTALAVPLAASAPGSRPGRAEALGAAMALFAALILLVDRAIGPGQAAGLVVCGAAFSALLAGVTRAVLACRASRPVAQAAGTLVACGLAGAVFASGPILSMVAPAARPAAVRWLVAIDPLSGPVGDLLGVDWLKGPRAYRATPIGPHYPYAYPAWATVATVQAGVGVALTLVARRRRAT